MNVLKNGERECENGEREYQHGERESTTFSLAESTARENVVDSLSQSNEAQVKNVVKIKEKV